MPYICRSVGVVPGGVNVGIYSMYGICKHVCPFDIPNLSRTRVENIDSEKTTEVVE